MYSSVEWVGLRCAHGYTLLPEWVTTERNANRINCRTLNQWVDSYVLTHHVCKDCRQWGRIMMQVCNSYLFQWKPSFRYWLYILKGCQTQFLEGSSPAEFSFNPAPTHTPCSFQISLNVLISWIGCVWIGLNLNFAGLWPSRNWVWHPRLKGIVQPKNKNSVIHYSLLCCPKHVRPSFIFRTQMNIYFLLNLRALWPCMDRNRTDTFKAQKGSKDIVKLVHVTSVVQP